MLAKPGFPLVLAIAVLDCSTTSDRGAPPAISLTPNAAVPTSASSTVASIPANVVSTAAQGPYKYMLESSRDEVSHAITLVVKMIPAATPESVITVATLKEPDVWHKIVRADSTSIVISRADDYGFGDPVKLFLDPVTKTLVKKVDFSSNEGLDVFGDHEAAAALALPEDLIQGLKEREAQPKPDEPWDSVLPKVLRDHPMPQPSYADFARQRPGRVDDGYDSASTDIGEIPGPFQFVGSRIWFGKRFYDGEGSTGIGGVGFFDTTTSKYTFLEIPEVVGWSVSAILVDEKSIWIGLVSHPEGADHSGGLLRYDIGSKATKKFDLDEVALSIRGWNGHVYVATPHGLIVLNGEKVTDRYVVEPDIDEKSQLLHFAAVDAKTP